MSEKHADNSAAFRLVNIFVFSVRVYTKQSKRRREVGNLVIYERDEEKRFLPRPPVYSSRNVPIRFEFARVQ